MSSTTPLNVPVPSISELTQNAARLLQQALAEASQASGPAALSTTDLELARSNVRALSFVQAVGLHGAYRYLRDFIARQAVPVFSAAAFLDGWLATYGMQRREASAATGQAQGTGVNGTVLPAGSLLQDDAGHQYRVMAAATVVGGVVNGAVIAVVAGAASNLGEDGDLTLVSPIVGIDAAFNTADGIGGGTDIETDALAVYRLAQRLSAEPMGGTPADYARWALQVPGITRAWGIRNPAGATSAGVLIMADGNAPDGLPTVGQRDQVLDYIRDPQRGPPDELFVIIPTLVPINFQIRISPDTPANRADALAELQDLFFREALPGGQIPQSHATEALSSVVGEYNHTVLSPAISSGAFFTVATFDELLTLGTVTWVP